MDEKLLNTVISFNDLKLSEPEISLLKDNVKCSIKEKMTYKEIHDLCMLIFHKTVSLIENDGNGPQPLILYQLEYILDKIADNAKAIVDSINTQDK